MRKNVICYLFALCGSCLAVLHRAPARSWGGPHWLCSQVMTTCECGSWLAYCNGTEWIWKNDETETAAFTGQKALNVWMVHCIGWAWLWARLALHCWSTLERKITWTACKTPLSTVICVPFFPACCPRGKYRSVIPLNDRD